MTLTAALCSAGAAGAMIWAVRGRSSGLFGPSVWRGPGRSPVVALTFDDGPSESTPRLLEVLAKHGVKATFFQCGAHVRRLPAVAREVAAAGHEIGNHSDTHPLFCCHAPGFVERELIRAQEAIAEATGKTPVFFRAPYGVRWFGLRTAQRRLGLTGVMWTVIGRDWTLQAGAIEQRVLRGICPGAIVCLHDGRGIRRRPDIRPTVQAVDHLVPALLDRGLQFATISSLLCPTTLPTES